jgi:hypothetical protein
VVLHLRVGRGANSSSTKKSIVLRDLHKGLGHGPILWYDLSNGKGTLWERGEMYTRFWWGNLRKIGQLEEPGVDERIIFRWIFRKWDLGLWTKSIWLRIGTVGGHL